MSAATAGGGGMGGMFSRTVPGFGAAQQMTRSLPWTSAGSGGGGGGTGGQIAKLERLQRLRESGALTDAEFDREKAKILSEG